MDIIQLRMQAAFVRFDAASDAVAATRAEGAVPPSMLEIRELLIELATSALILGQIAKDIEAEEPGSMGLSLKDFPR